MKTVLITGATGFLGHNLVNSFIERGDTYVIAVLGRPEDKANTLPESDRLKIYPSSAVFSTEFGHIDTLIHTAFSRFDNYPGLTRSIEFSEQIIELVNNQDIDSIINISSQGVYKWLRPGEKVNENGFVEPDTAYGLAKWAVENMLKVGCKKKFTNIRMASLSSNARFLDFFVESVIAGKDITVTAPNQYASIMDVSDAVRGILLIESMNINEREVVYNLGPGTQYSILDYAESAKNIGLQFGCSSINIKVEDKGVSLAMCMDVEKLISKVSWKPQVDKDLMLVNIFKSKIK